MDAEFSRFVAGRRHHAATFWVSTDDDGFTFQRGIGQFLHRNEERVHVNVKDLMNHDDSGALRTPACDDDAWNARQVWPDFPFFPADAEQLKHRRFLIVSDLDNDVAAGLERLKRPRKESTIDLFAPG